MTFSQLRRACRPKLHNLPTVNNLGKRRNADVYQGNYSFNPTHFVRGKGQNETQKRRKASNLLLIRIRMCLDSCPSVRQLLWATLVDIDCCSPTWCGSTILTPVYGALHSACNLPTIAFQTIPPSLPPIQFEFKLLISLISFLPQCLARRYEF